MLQCSHVMHWYMRNLASFKYNSTFGHCTVLHDMTKMLRIFWGVCLTESGQPLNIIFFQCVTLSLSLRVTMHSKSTVLLRFLWLHVNHMHTLHRGHYVLYRIELVKLQLSCTLFHVKVETTFYCYVFRQSRKCQSSNNHSPSPGLY